MPTVSVNGCTIAYEEMGSGNPVVLTPGGRWGREYIRLLGERLSSRYRVILWDRRNCGASDVSFPNDRSEAEVWADDLAALITQLGVAPAILGEYAGGRTSPLVAIRHPQVVRALLLAWPTGTEANTDRMSKGLYNAWIEAVEQGGTEALTQVPHFAGRIAENAGNRDRILAMNPQTFVATARRWSELFAGTRDFCLTGCVASDDAMKSIKVPTMILSGGDPGHPPETAERLHRLIPDSELHPPAISLREWDKVFSGPYADASKVQGSLAAPVFLDFLQRRGL